MRTVCVGGRIVVDGVSVNMFGGCVICRILQFLRLRRCDADADADADADGPTTQPTVDSPYK